MLGDLLVQKTEQLPGLSENGLKLSRSIHAAVLKGGYPARKIADLLHGTWLGHPLHPMLTDVTVGAFTLATLFDVLAAARGARFAEKAADTLVSAGSISAVATAISGLADFSTVEKPAMSSASMHALLNSVNLGLYLLSLRDRKNGKRARGVFFSSLALALLAASAWLGGHLVYTHRVGVDHSEEISGPEKWTAVLPEAELPGGEPKAVDVEGSKVLLYRCEGTVHAINAVCSHSGGPLEEGEFHDFTVQCPWHDSVFDLRDGSVVHGPATHPQPAYQTRIRKGQVEIRHVAS